MTVCGVVFAANGLTSTMEQSYTRLGKYSHRATVGTCRGSYTLVTNLCTYQPVLIMKCPIQTCKRCLMVFGRNEEYNPYTI